MRRCSFRIIQELNQQSCPVIDHQPARPHRACMQVVNGTPQVMSRPVVTHQGPLAIVEGRHPLLEQLLPAGRLQVLQKPS